MPPTTTLWKLDGHTAAKHELIRRYLDAWLPIMARSGNNSVLVIDGFAGPGRYEGGEPGSPLVILDTFLSHRDRPAWNATSFTFAFVEKDRSRFDYLTGELARLTMPKNARVIPVHGEFDAEIQGLLDRIPKGFGLPPSFVFIDPFGWTGKHLELSSRILAFPKCEVLVYIPLPYIARFVGQEDVRGSLENLFGDDSWLPARDIEDGQQRAAFLHDLFLEKVRGVAGYARSFEIEAGGKGWNGYHLFFGTGHPRGLDRMKYAMWRVDPVAGSRFADSTVPGQLTLFESSPDVRPLQEALAHRFGVRPFTIEQAETFTTLETPYHPSIHLKKGALKPLELAGRIHVSERRKAGTYPAGTIIRFKRQ